MVNVISSISSLKMRLLITGGAGYVASRIVMHVLEKLSKNVVLNEVSEVILLDRMEPVIPAHPHSTTSIIGKQVDITDYASLVDHFKDVDAVYHLASYGMSGREQLHTETVWKVNLEGTKNVVRACLEMNVKYLIFTSTVNVVFGGQVIENGDESLPYYDAKLRVYDSYANSKTLAEKEIMQHNNTITQDGITRLRTCSLRLPGLYGPGEQRHFPRVAGIMRAGLFCMRYGPDTLVDFVHCDNVIHGLSLALRNLATSSVPSAAGNTYFLTDGVPINNFEFFRPMAEALGISYPRLILPFHFIYFLAFLVEWAYRLMHKIVDFQPLLSRAEVYKTGQTHYFSMKKISSELGYRPLYQNDLTETLLPYRVTQNKQKTPNSLLSILANVLIVLVIFSMLMSYLPITDSPVF